jgi:hypothetical protein
MCGHWTPDRTGEIVPVAQAYTGQRLDTRLRPALFYESVAKALDADVAQLAEQLICNQQVASSILAVGSAEGTCARRWWVWSRRQWRVGYPSGQREQTVNLPAHAFEGSNPSPTIGRKVGDRDRAITTSDQSQRIAAGVAQLVERKPSKLDVAGSSPVSRFVALRAPERK